MKKSAKNCTLYHVVNKSVWADIGATCAGSTNILLRLVMAAPIGEDTQTFYNFKKFADFFKCLQRQYIGANWFAAPIYWRSTRRIKMFAAPRLFSQTMPIQAAGVSGSGNRIIPRWRPN